MSHLTTSEFSLSDLSSSSIFELSDSELSELSELSLSDFATTDLDTESDNKITTTGIKTSEKIETKSSSNEFITNEFTKLCKNYEYIPLIHDKVKRIIVLGDIHGDYNLAINLMKIGKVIKTDNDGNVDWIGGDTVVVQVGDQIDRCRPQGKTCNNDEATPDDEASDVKILNLFTDLHYKAKKSGGKVISLLGNHELLNVEGYMSYVSKMNFDDFTDYIDSENPSLAFRSGEDARRHAFKPGNEMAKFLACTRVTCLIIGSNLFVHAGLINSIMDHLKIKKNTDIIDIDILVKKWLLGLINKEYVKHIVNGNELSMFWTRILGNIPSNTSNENNKCLDYIGSVLETFKIGSIVIGHTPQSFLHNEGINSVCDNRVWRVDNGSSAAFNSFDKQYLETGVINKNREPQVLEILDDKYFNVLR
ncbi:MAG: metallophosphatase/phosphoesterase [Terrestrivirus sp.]|uniref:Metallophosphatase/phosphoesterase n=1 Tax=Terrestrivirus sp. TaxID=2487775 RepID=A0A3G4ZR08_9VIRU|nr:MAG: metallophosphatase/phosphoesterase [Terrestrivirus sp.]